MKATIIILTLLLTSCTATIQTTTNTTIQEASVTQTTEDIIPLPDTITAGDYIISTQEWDTYVDDYGREQAGAKKICGRAFEIQEMIPGQPEYTMVHYTTDGRNKEYTNINNVRKATAEEVRQRCNL